MLSHAILSAYATALHGDFAELDAAAGESNVWTLVRSSLGWFAGLPDGRIISRAEVAELSAPDELARTGIGILCAHGGRAGWLGFDRGEVRAWVELHESLCGDSDDPLVSARLAASRCWLVIVDGDPSEVGASADTIGAAAREHADSSLAIEAAVLASLAATEAAEIDDALRHARRASRMGRTEALPQEEYLANLVLARLRRLTGHPHLALRILTGLLRVATDPWRPSLVWEQLLSQGAEGTAPLPASRSEASAAVADLRAMLLAAREGDRGEFELHAGQLAGREKMSTAHLRDVATVRPVLDPDAPLSEGGDGVRQWREGTRPEPPDGLFGLCGRADDVDELAFVLAESGRPPRRVLFDGVQLAQARPLQRLAETPARQARTETTIATLVLAGPDGLAEDELFESIYGFPYGGERHRGVRNVLYHRVRARLADVATLHREDDRIMVVHVDPLLVPDPRCSPPPEHSMLHELARMGDLSAAEAAEKLNINVRSAQRALRRLTDDGACRAVKEGRNLRFYLEDTTYCEPTVA